MSFTAVLVSAIIASPLDDLLIAAVVKTLLPPIPEINMSDSFKVQTVAEILANLATPKPISFADKFAELGEKMIDGLANGDALGRVGASLMAAGASIKDGYEFEAQRQLVRRAERIRDGQKRLADQIAKLG